MCGTASSRCSAGRSKICMGWGSVMPGPPGDARGSWAIPWVNTILTGTAPSTTRWWSCPGKLSQRVQQIPGIREPVHVRPRRILHPEHPPSARQLPLDRKRRAEQQYQPPVLRLRRTDGDLPAHMRQPRPLAGGGKQPRNRQTARGTSPVCGGIQPEYLGLLPVENHQQVRRVDLLFPQATPSNPRGARPAGFFVRFSGSLRRAAGNPIPI